MCLNKNVESATQLENATSLDAGSELMSEQENSQFDPPMTDEEAELVGQLSESELEFVDGFLIENIGQTWMKSAFLIGGVMLKIPDEYEELPDTFYSARLMVLEKKGLIAVKGDLRKMKLCEIQLSA